MRVFLAGASGFAGARVLEDLVAAGHEVTALAHSERSRRELLRAYPDVTIVSGDVARAPDMLRAVPRGIEAIIYLPGLLREFPRKGITFHNVHVEGVRNVLAAALRSGAARWIQMSALGVKPNAATGYYRTKWEAEELVRASGLDWTILRPSLIFDARPRKQHNFVDEIAKAIRMAPFVPILGNGEFLLQPVSVDDVSQTILQSLAKPESMGKIYELGGPETVTYRELVQTIARAMGSKKRAIKIPLEFLESLARIFGRFSWFPISVEELRMLQHGNYIHDPSEEKRWRETFELPLVRFTEEMIRRIFELTKK